MITITHTQSAIKRTFWSPIRTSFGHFKKTGFPEKTRNCINGASNVPTLRAVNKIVHTRKETITVSTEHVIIDMYIDKYTQIDRHTTAEKERKWKCESVYVCDTQTVSECESELDTTAYAHSTHTHTHTHTHYLYSLQRQQHEGE